MQKRVSILMRFSPDGRLWLAPEADGLPLALIPFLDFLRGMPEKKQIRD